MKTLSCIYSAEQHLVTGMRLKLISLCIYVSIVLEILHLKFGLHLANSQIVSSPLNTAVLSGEPTEMNCSVNPDSYTIVFCSWEFIRSGSFEESTIYTPALGINKPVTSFELRHQSNSSCDLIAKEVQLRDAGLYICNTRLKNAVNGSTIIEQNSAQLIVLESRPYCDRDVDAVKHHCSVFYQGNWPPEIEWRRNNGQTIPGVMSHGAHGNISNTLDDKENAAYTCVVQFATYSGNITMTARNRPTLSNRFTCPSTRPTDAPFPDTSTPRPSSETISTESIASGLMSCGAIVLTGILIWVSVLRCKKNRTDKSMEPSLLPESVEPIEPMAPVAPLQSMEPVAGVVHIAPRAQCAHATHAQMKPNAHFLLPSDQSPMTQHGDIQYLGEDGISPNLNSDWVNPEQRRANVRGLQYENVEYASIDQKVWLLPPPLHPR